VNVIRDVLFVLLVCILFNVLSSMTTLMSRQKVMDDLGIMLILQF